MDKAAAKKPATKKAPSKAASALPVSAPWKQNSTMGRKPIFESPEQLWDMCIEYFQWVEENPLPEEVIFHFKGSITRATKYKLRAMTIGGLCIFLDIAHQTWLNYKARADFLEVVTRTEEIIRDQKFVGAAAELFNPNIIARDLGLKERVDQEVKQTNVIDRDMRKAMIKALLSKARGKPSGDLPSDPEAGEDA